MAHGVPAGARRAGTRLGSRRWTTIPVPLVSTPFRKGGAKRNLRRVNISQVYYLLFTVRIPSIWMSVILRNLGSGGCFWRGDLGYMREAEIFEIVVEIHFLVEMNSAPYRNAYIAACTRMDNAHVSYACRIQYVAQYTLVQKDPMH